MNTTPATILQIPTAEIIGDPKLVPYGRDNASVLLSCRVMVRGMGRSGGNGFIDITVFDNAEQLNEQIAKGSRVRFEGELRFREWESNGRKSSALSAAGELFPIEDDQ